MQEHLLEHNNSLSGYICSFTSYDYTSGTGPQCLFICCILIRNMPILLASLLETYVGRQRQRAMCWHNWGAHHYQSSLTGFRILQNVGLIPWFLIRFQQFPTDSCLPNKDLHITWQYFTGVHQNLQEKQWKFDFWFQIYIDFASDIHLILGATDVVLNHGRPVGHTVIRAPSSKMHLVSYNSYA